MSAAKPLSLYVHWPFCLSRCPYCDFNAHVRDSIDQQRWRAALLTELGWWAEQMPERQLVSIFFGGGTPSLMTPETTAAIIAAAKGYWGADKGLEVTLEANPTSVEAGRFAELRAAGVNRLSIGVQALNNESLRFLGRGHDVKQALAAIQIAEDLFPRHSFDLIYGLPGQSVADWGGELEQALSLAGGHLSLYQLTIERGTPFFTRLRSGEFTLPDEDTGAALFDLTQEMCEAHNMPAYEISNHAKPGEECRHNVLCWTGGDYVGVGPGAHGRLVLDGAPCATEQIPGPENWLSEVEQSGHATRRRDILDAQTRCEETIMTGLRLTTGIKREDFLDQCGLEIEDALEPRRLRRLLDGEMLTLDDAGLRTTPAGRIRLNAVLEALLA